MSFRFTSAFALIGVALLIGATQAESQAYPASQRATVTPSRAVRVFHLPYPGAERDALRIDVTPEQASHMESFAIYFPSVLRDEAVMRLHWGTTALPVRIKAAFKPAA